MANIGQTVVIRTDLFDLTKDMGLITAQVAHIHAQSCFQLLRDGVKPNEGLSAWLEEPYLYVKRVDSYEAFEYIRNYALNESGISVNVWYDTVYVRITPTQQKAIKAPVGLSLGPDDSDAIRRVVGDLPLL